MSPDPRDLLPQPPWQGPPLPDITGRGSRQRDADDLREVLFTIYDSMSVLAGGRETGMGSELSLLSSKVDALVRRGVLHSIDQAKVVPGYIAAIEQGDGAQAHFYSRMIFRETVDILKDMAIGKR